MEKTERNEHDDSQKAKLVFISLAALVTILLIWSLVSANNARSDRDKARQEVEALKSDNAKLEQMVKDQNQELESLRKKVTDLEAKAKAKPAKKKAAAPAKKKTTKKKH
jgi:chromosome segregation ATPase